MDEYVGDIRQRVLERMDLSREMSDEEIENLIGEEASRLMQEEPISIRERLMLEARDVYKRQFHRTFRLFFGLF